MFLTYLQVYAALLSTILALIKIYEVLQSRLKLIANYRWSVGGDGADEIDVINLSGKTIHVTSWGLLRGSQLTRAGLVEDITPAVVNDPKYEGFTIPPNGKFVVKLDNARCFECLGIHYYEEINLFLDIAGQSQYRLKINRPKYYEMISTKISMFELDKE